MKTALLGFGTVGHAFYVLAGQHEQLQVNTVLSLAVQPQVLCRQTTDFQDVLNDPEISLVVELIGGLHPAYEYVSAALRAGKHVVTANKLLMCTCYRELVALAREHGVCLRCTAAAGGGIPWLNSLSRLAQVDTVNEVWGVMNGTTNYILSAMADTGADYAQSLRDAQRLGFAEADPTADVEGLDARRKIALSANIAFGMAMEERDVPCFGISTVTAQDMAAFEERGLCCKLIAHAHCRNGRVTAAVEPMLLPRAHCMAQTGGADNLIALRAEHTGEQRFFGAGAGGYPTAGNVLADCLEIVRGCTPFYTDRMRDMPIDHTLTAHRYYIRGAEPDGARERWGAGYITETITTAQAHAMADKMKEKAPALFMAALAEEA